MITTARTTCRMLMKMQRMKMNHRRVPDLLDPEELRDQHVAADHQEVGPPERAERAIDERELLVEVARVPRDEELGGVSETDHHAGAEHDLAPGLDVAVLDDVLEVEQVAQRISSVNTIAKPLKMAPATKYGGKIVVCQPGSCDVAKSNDTTEWTLNTSGVARPARIRYARS